MSSSLLDQSSLYLRQHANQPVNWLTWSEESIKKAQKEDKPILLSIGYSSCHWCQEMSRNCFEDRYIASLMNRHFICILVDREENPELDHIYMDAVRMFEQSAGWPLHAFCLPDGRPFWGGTYFPKEDLGNGMAPWSQILIRISEHYRKAKDELIENAENVIANILHSNNTDHSSGKRWHNAILGTVTEMLCEKHDHINGGFTSAPKFPSPMKVDLLLSMRETNFLRSQKDKLEKVNHCIDQTLLKLSNGGIYDHLGGGFFRYCTDEKWTQPYYEKTLSDNALMLRTFSRAHRDKPKENYRRIVSETLSWLNKEMGTPEIGYASSLSSESNNEEGAAYEWTLDEFVSVLGKEDGEKFFNSLPELSKNQRKLPQVIEARIIPMEEQLSFISLLRQQRGKKPPAHPDEKRLLSHNSLVISAFIEASIALNDINLLEDAIRLEKWITKNFTDKNNNIQSFIYPGNKSASEANLDDYCFWVLALVDLHSICSIINEDKCEEYLEKAIKFTDDIVLKFKDFEAPGYFFTDKNLTKPLPCKKKIWYDNVTPAGNSMLLQIFSTLFSLTHEKKWETEFEEILKVYPSLASKVSDGVCFSMASICDKEMGTVSIELPKTIPSNDIEFVSKLPSRRIFYNFRQGEPKEFKVFADNELVLTTDDREEVIKLLNN